MGIFSDFVIGLEKLSSLLDTTLSKLEKSALSLLVADLTNKLSFSDANFMELQNLFLAIVNVEDKGPKKEYFDHLFSICWLFYGFLQCKSLL